MNGLDLFAGSGIGSLALKHTIPNYRSLGYVEWEKYCCRIIEQRIKDGILCDAPVYHLDIREFNRTVGPMYSGLVDIISGGFPCQPFSVAGKNKGESDERNMWPATLECISIIRPRFALLENVPNILTHEYIRRIFGDLAEIGYDCEWGIASAASVGAPHLRKRVWVLAHSNSIGTRTGLGQIQETDGEISERDINAESGNSGQEYDVAHSVKGSENVSNTINSQTTRHRKDSGEIYAEPKSKGFNNSRSNWWSTEPDVGRVAHGVASRVDRLKMLGNGWVPQVVRRILQINRD